jgi:hypothetical protein
VWFNILAVVVALNVMATISLWQAAARRPEKVKRKFFDALLNGEPITPRHQPPRAVSSLASDEDRRFFRDFEDFAEVVNWWLADEHIGSSWRLQELPDTELKFQLSDMPMFGRRYSIFRNQVHIGALEVSPDYKHSTERPAVRTEIQLWYARLLNYDDASEFLSAMAMHVCDMTEDRVQWRMAIETGMTRALWQSHHIAEFGKDGEDYGEIQLQFNGSAAGYFQRRDVPAFIRRRRDGA